MRTIVRVMGTPLTLVAADVPALDDAAVRRAVRAAFVELGSGRAVQPAQSVVDLPDGGDVITYQAALAGAGVFAVKVSPYLPRPGQDAVVTAWTLLLSTRTGQPLLLVDSGVLTVERTAATTALAVDLLARPDASSLAVIGLGPVGRAHLRHVLAVRDIQDVRLFSPTATPEGVADLAVGQSARVRLATSADAAADGADVVLLCTSAAEPVIDVSRVAPGSLVTSVSTNAPGAHEVDPAALAGTEVYVDHLPGALDAAAELGRAVAEHGLNTRAVRGDLAALVTGRSPAPTGQRPVFFRSVGLGLEDAAIAHAVLAAVTKESS